MVTNYKKTDDPKPPKVPIISAKGAHNKNS